MSSSSGAASSTLVQVKLTGEEWNGVEIMEPEEEMRILKLIIDGFHNVNITFNTHQSLILRLKITQTPEMEDFIFDEYFKKRVEIVISKQVIAVRSSPFKLSAKSKKVMKKVDLM